MAGGINDGGGGLSALDAALDRKFTCSPPVWRPRTGRPSRPSCLLRSGPPFPLRTSSLKPTRSAARTRSQTPWCLACRGDLQQLLRFRLCRRRPSLPGGNPGAAGTVASGPPPRPPSFGMRPNAFEVGLPKNSHRKHFCQELFNRRPTWLWMGPSQISLRLRRMKLLSRNGGLGIDLFVVMCSCDSRDHGKRPAWAGSVSAMPVEEVVRPSNVGQARAVFPVSHFLSAPSTPASRSGTGSRPHRGAGCGCGTPSCPVVEPACRAGRLQQGRVALAGAGHLWHHGPAARSAGPVAARSFAGGKHRYPCPAVRTGPDTGLAPAT